MGGGVTVKEAWIGVVVGKIVCGGKRVQMLLPPLPPSPNRILIVQLAQLSYCK